MKSSTNGKSHRLAGLAAILLLGLLAMLVWKNSSRKTGGTPLAVAAKAQPLDRPEVSRPEPVAEAGMNPLLLKILGLKNGLNPAARIEQLRRYNESLSDDETRLLLHFLLQGPDGGEDLARYSEYMHEICCLLGKQEPKSPQFAPVLAAIAVDTRRDETVRDYSLQHLRVLWETSDSSLRDRIVASIETIASADSPLAPSALLSLHLLGSAANSSLTSGSSLRAPPSGRFALPDSRIKPAVTAILARSAEASNTVARLTATRIIRERSFRDHLADLHKIADGSSGDQAVVRMAAIATIAELGSPSDITFLKTLDRRDPRIDSVLRHSLVTTP